MPSHQSSLALSTLHQRLKNLEAENQWFLRQIKKKKTELTNFVHQMQAIAHEIFIRSIPITKRLIEIDQEIHDLFTEILDNKQLGKSSRKKIKRIYYNLQYAGLISSKSETENLDIDELFGEEIPPQSPDDSPNGVRDTSPDGKKIRQIFLRLAEIFHPDKVRDSETQKHHTEIMKELNKAYQSGDLAKLLEIEQQYYLNNPIVVNNEDDLTRQCENIEHQNQLLKQQYEELKQELRQVKNTPEGSMVTSYRKAARENIDLIEEMVEEVEQQFQYIQRIYNFIRDFHDKKISIKQFLDTQYEFTLGEEEVLEKFFQQFL